MSELPHTIEHCAHIVNNVVSELGMTVSPEETVSIALALYRSIVELQEKCKDKSIPETIFVSVICTLVMDLKNVSNGKPLARGVFVAVRDDKMPDIEKKKDPSN